MTMLSTSSVFQLYGTSIKHWDHSYTFRNIISYTIYCIFVSNGVNECTFFFIGGTVSKACFLKQPFHWNTGKSCYPVCQGPPEVFSVRHQMANYCSTNCNLLTVNIIYSHTVADLLLVYWGFVAFNCRNYRKLTRKVHFFLETETKLLYFHFITHCHTVWWKVSLFQNVQLPWRRVYVFYHMYYASK